MSGGGALAKGGGGSGTGPGPGGAEGTTSGGKLFDVIAPRYAKRNGGYAQVIKAGIRMSDAAPIAVIDSSIAT